MQEKHLVLCLLGLAVAGQAARLLWQRQGNPPGELLTESATLPDPGAQRARALQLNRPLASGESIDLNLTSPEGIARLPRVGMSLAKRIVGYREAHGPFRSLTELDAVPGVGPALLDLLKGKVTFGGTSRPGQWYGNGDISHSPVASYEKESGLVDLNMATESDLRGLPGIGPARARAILAYRRDKGPFAAVSELRAVPGFGQSLIRRLEPLVTVR